VVYNLLTVKNGGALFEQVDENVRPTIRPGGALGRAAQHSKSDQRKYSLAVRAVNAWNHLPLARRSEASTQQGFVQRGDESTKKKNGGMSSLKQARRPRRRRLTTKMTRSGYFPPTW